MSLKLTKTFGHVTDCQRFFVLCSYFLSQHLEFLRLLKRHQLFDRLLAVYNHYIRLFGATFGLRIVDDPKNPFTISFKAEGFWNTVALWIEEEPVRSPEVMAKIITEFMEKSFS